MAAPIKQDAGFTWTENGQNFTHYLGAKLRRPASDIVQPISAWESADLRTIRRIAIGDGVADLETTIRYDGQPDQFERFLAAGRRGVSLTYFPSLADTSVSVPCILVEASRITTDPDLWWQQRYQSNVRLRRIDGGVWDAITLGALFYFRAGNEPQGVTFTRSGAVGPYTDSDGVLKSAAADDWRINWDWLGSSTPQGAQLPDTPTLVLENAKTNVADNDDVTTWNSSGSPTVTSSVDDPAGGANAFTIEDANAGSVDVSWEQFTLTGDGVKTVVFVVRENTPPTNHQQLDVWDNVAGAFRLRFDIDSWTDGQPDITVDTGTLLGMRFAGNGYWAIYGETTSVTAANAHLFEVRPAAAAAGETGSIDFYRINVYDSTVPAVSILDASEVLSAETWFAGFAHAPQEMTVYVKFVERGTALLTDGRGLFYIGSATTGADPRFTVTTGAGNRYRCVHDNGTTTANAALAAGPSFGDLVEIRAVLNDDGSVVIGQSLNSAAETTASDATAVTLQPAWADTRIYLNSQGAGVRGVNAFIECKILPGIKTMAEMRSA